MYSFYGGQKGQDFKISRIFSNRSNDLLQDLQARWYSPINVGDYVLISYGDVAESNTLITNKQGKSTGEKSNYDKNLEIDLLNCGKSYTNSIWQKIYVEDNKNVSPDFPDSEENVYVFINFEEDENEPEKFVNENGIVYYTIKDKNGISHKCDEYGNWLNDFDQIIHMKQKAGYSLLETSDIYSEENFGFGYRLIACVTGQTPRIQVFHEAINIEDDDPHVTYDLTNPDRPEIKFYLQRAQRIDQLYMDILGPVFNPNVSLLINKEDIREINGEKVRPSLTKPILEFQVPRAVKYFSGLLFGGGSLSDVPFNYTDLNGDLYTNISFTETLDQIKIIAQAATILSDAINEGKKSGNFEKAFYNYIHSIFNPKNFENNNNFLKGYYFFKKIDNVDDTETVDPAYTTLLDYLKSRECLEDNLPWGFYGLNKNSKYENLNDYCYKIFEELEKRQTVLTKCFSKEDNINKLITEILTDEEKTSINFSSETDSALTLIEYIEKYYCGSYNFINKDSFDLFSEEEKKNYCLDYLDGFSQSNDLYLIANLFNYQTPIISIKDFIININRFVKDNTVNFHFVNDEIKYIQKILSQMYYLLYHFELVSLKALPGDIYIHTPSGRLYQFMSVEKEELKVNYIGILSAPAPTVESKIVPSFIQKLKDGTTEYEYIKNNISVQSNKIISDNNDILAHREKYTFSIPETPNFEASVEEISNNKIASVNKIIKDQSTINFDFSLPKSIKFFTYNDLAREIPNFEVNKGPRLKSGLIPDINDLYIHTTSDLDDSSRGWIYKCVGNQISEKKQYIVRIEGTNVSSNCFAKVIFDDITDIPYPDNDYIYEANDNINIEIYMDVGDKRGKCQIIRNGQTYNLGTSGNYRFSTNAESIYIKFYYRYQNVVDNEGIPILGEHGHLQKEYVYYTQIVEDDIIAKQYLIYLWEKQGSILGPIGIPNPIISISLYAYPYTTEPEGQITQKDDNNNYYVNEDKLNNLSDIIKQLFTNFNLKYPDSSKGQIAIIKIYKNLYKEETETEKYKQFDNYWAQYSKADEKWYLTLMTAQGNFMSNEKITDETAKDITYTAQYINTISPEWDTTTYF